MAAVAIAKPLLCYDIICKCSMACMESSRTKVIITLQGYKHQKAYIIAEGPMLSTVRNMLKILYDRKVGAVVMLSGFMENGQVIA